MKYIKSTLSVIAFILAITGAFALRDAVGQTGYSRKVDVAGQVPHCQARLYCDEGGQYDCTVVIDNVVIQLYSRHSISPMICETPLKRSLQ